MEAPLIVTIALMVLFAAVSAGLWARRPGARPIMGGIGAILIPLGLYLFGLMDLAYNGVVSIIDWAQRTPWTVLMTWGVSLVGVGVILFLVSRFIKPAGRPVATKPETPAVASTTTPTGRAGAGAVTASSSSAQPAPVSAKKTAEDDEVEDILRKRGLL